MPSAGVCVFGGGGVLMMWHRTQGARMSQSEATQVNRSLVSVRFVSRRCCCRVWVCLRRRVLGGV